MTLIRMLSEDKNREYYRNRCNALEQLVNKLSEKNRLLEEEQAALKETVSALVARNIKETTNGHRTESGIISHKILMSIKETCMLRELNFYDYTLKYLGGIASKL